MYVKMMKNRYFGGSFCGVGEVVDVDDDRAMSWLRDGAAVAADRPVDHVEAEPKPAPEPIVAKVKRKYTRKKKAD